jgi:hypothetical protein
LRELTGSELLAMPVRLHGLLLGRPVDLLLDRDGLRAVGLDVLCEDGSNRFLPLPAASIANDIAVSSPLVLLEEDELAFYRRRALTLGELRGRLVERRGSALGTCRDVVVSTDGSLRAVMVESGKARRRVPFDSSISFAPRRRTAA